MPIALEVVFWFYQGTTFSRAAKHGKRLGLQPLPGRILPEYFRKSFIMQCLWCAPKDSNRRLPRRESDHIK